MQAVIWDLSAHTFSLPSLCLDGKRLGYLIVKVWMRLRLARKETILVMQKRKLSF